MERNEEMIRSALRSIAAAAKIPNVESATKFDEFLKQTVLVSPLAEKYLSFIIIINTNNEKYKYE